MTSSGLIRQGALQAIFHDGLWKSDRDFLVMFHIITFYLLCTVSEITRFYCKPDMTSSWFLRKETFYTGFVDGIWKSDLSFIIMVHWHIPRISYSFELIRQFILAGNCQFRKTPQNSRITHVSFPFLTPDCVSWAIMCENWFTGMGCSFVEEEKDKKSHRTHICCLLVASRTLIRCYPNLARLVTCLT